MKRNQIFPLAAAALLLTGVHARGQQTAPTSAAAASALTESVLGRSVVHPRDGLEVAYTVLATQPLNSKLTGQKLRLEIEESGVRDVTLEDGKVIQQKGKYSRSVSVSTGKHKTLGQLCGILNSVFRQFLVGAAANQDLGKIGDAKYGGELHFVAEGPDRLRFDYVPNQTKPEDAVRFSRADVQAFGALLK